MKHVKTWHWMVLSFFVVSRLFIWIFKPPYFTEIIYSYMPYAHLWASGDRPYLDQWYEYPPATIPLFYIPHLIDRGTLGQIIHIDYMQAYRGLLLLVDISIFSLIFLLLQRFAHSDKLKIMGLIYYILATSKAHHFIYDTMDLTFTGAMFLGVASLSLWSGSKAQLGSWVSYFLAVALKYVNGPLGLVYAVLQRKSLKQTVLSIALGGLIVWGLPLAMYRSSLQVSLVYHQIRGLQVESMPAVLSSTINHFTHTEEFVEAFKNYEIHGPVSDTIKHWFDLIFPVSIAVCLIFLVKWLWTTRSDWFHASLFATLVYLFTFALTSKVLSTPFLLWHVPFVAVLPLEKTKDYLHFLVPSLLIIFTSMSPIPNLTVGIFTIHLFIGWIRVGGFAYMLYQLIKHKDLFLKLQPSHV